MYMSWHHEYAGACGCGMSMYMSMCDMMYECATHMRNMAHEHTMHALCVCEQEGASMHMDI